jgi:hypothetical protein
MMTSHLSMVKLCLLFACFLLFTNEASAMHGYRIDDTDMIVDQTLDMDNTFSLSKRNRAYCGTYLRKRLMDICKSVYNKRKAPDAGIHAHKLLCIQFPMTSNQFLLYSQTT